MKKSSFCAEEQWLCYCLKMALKGSQLTDNSRDSLSADFDWQRLFQMAKSQGVLALMYEVLYPCPVLPANKRLELERYSHKLIYQYYYLLYQTARVIRLLEDAGLTTVVLKGVSSAAYYAIPQTRKSGDIDILLIDEHKIDKALQILKKNQFIPEQKRYVAHHYSCTSPEGVTVELHIHLVEPFDNKRVNDWLKEFQRECQNHILRKEIIGESLPVFDRPYYAFYILLHMLQHFLRAGFGLKMLSDWVVFWNGEISPDEQAVFLNLVKECRLVEFARLITETGIRFLGLEREKVAFLLSDDEEPRVNRLLRELLDAGEFGQNEPDRLVTLKGTKLTDYLREFHHQMRLRHPRTSRSILLWPVLWGITLIVFVRNNRQRRGVSTLAVLKRARERSRFIGGLRLFK